MTRRRVRLWTRLTPTSPKELLARVEGDALVQILTDWWIDGEGIRDGRAAAIDHRRRSVTRRYRRKAFYQVLKEADFPPLPDRDELALDAVHHVFARWVATRQARQLVKSVTAYTHGAVEQRLRQATQSATSAREGIAATMAEVLDQLPDQITAQLHQHIHREVHERVYHQVSGPVPQLAHHPVHHNATQSTGSHGHGGHTHGGNVAGHSGGGHGHAGNLGAGNAGSS